MPSMVLSMGTRIVSVSAVCVSEDGRILIFTVG